MSVLRPETRDYKKVETIGFQPFRPSGKCKEQFCNEVVTWESPVYPYCCYECQAWDWEIQRRKL